MTNEGAGQKVLVTGATGFIGRHVVAQLLQQGKTVIAVSRTASGLPSHANLEHLPLDLHDQAAVSTFIQKHRPHALIHLAWEATPGLFWHSAENFKWLSSSSTLLQQFVAAGGSTAVLAGTCAEYKWENEILHEDSSPVNPTTLYSASKHAFHTLAQVIAKDINLIWARIFLPYGPDEDENKLISHIVREIQTGNEPTFQTPGRAADFIHVQDVACVLVALAHTHVSGTLNICSGKAVTPLEIAQMVSLELGKMSLAETFRQRLETTKTTSRVQGSTQRFDDICPQVQRRTLVDGLSSYFS